MGFFYDVVKLFGPVLESILAQKLLKIVKLVISTKRSSFIKEINHVTIFSALAAEAEGKGSIMSHFPIRKCILLPLIYSTQTLLQYVLCIGHFVMVVEGCRSGAEVEQEKRAIFREKNKTRSDAK